MNKTIMKTINALLKFTCLALMFACAASVAQAQQFNAQLQLDNLEPLAAKANEVVDVNLPESLLKIIPVKSIKNGNVREIVAGLRGVYVKNFEFNNDGEYTQSDVNSIRTQLKAPGWTRFVNVVNRREGQNVEVYMMNNGGKIDGLAVLAFEPKSLTVVNIVGVIDIDKLVQLEGQFGIPDLEIESEHKTEIKKVNKPPHQQQ